MTWTFQGFDVSRRHVCVTGVKGCQSAVILSVLLSFEYDQCEQVL